MGVAVKECFNGNLLLPCDALELDASNPALGTRPRKIAAEGTPLSVSENGLQSSGEEDDDSVSVDLVDEIPSEVGVSESVSPDQDLPSDSLENHAAAEGTNGTSDETESAKEGSAENDETEPSGEEDNAELDVPTQTSADLDLQFPGKSAIPVVRCLSVNPIQASVAAAIQPGVSMLFTTFKTYLLLEGIRGTL